MPWIVRHHRSLYVAGGVETADDPQYGPVLRMSRVRVYPVDDPAAEGIGARSMSVYRPGPFSVVWLPEL